MASIRKLSSTEKFSSSQVLADKLNTVTFAVRPEKDSQSNYALTCALDFSTVTNEELITLATRAIVIDLQRKWRVSHAGDKTEPTTNEFATVDVHKMITETTKGKPANPAAKAKKALDLLSPEARKALLDEYLKSIAGK